jgi:hypothetical protein
MVICCAPLFCIGLLCCCFVLARHVCFACGSVHCWSYANVLMCSGSSVHPQFACCLVPLPFMSLCQVYLVILLYSQAFIISHGQQQSLTYQCSSPFWWAALEYDMVHAAQKQVTKQEWYRWCIKTNFGIEIKGHRHQRLEKTFENWLRKSQIGSSAVHSFATKATMYGTEKILYRTMQRINLHRQSWLLLFCMLTTSLTRCICTFEILSNIHCNVNENRDD